MVDCVQNNRKTTDSVFANLFLAAKPKIFRHLLTLLASKSDADDALQETCIVMWSRFEDFNHKDELTESSINQMVAWGNKIAYYQAMNVLRKKKLASTSLNNIDLGSLSDDWMRQNQISVIDIKHSALRECLKTLSELQKTVLTSYYWDKESVSDIARKTDRSVAGIYSLLRRTRIDLRNKICIKILRYER